MSGGEDLFGLVGYQLDGKYDVEAAVAKGGFGVVYRARHASLLTWHAVKVLRVPRDLPAEMHPKFLKQFVDEARIIAQFQHPAVVRVTDFGVSTMPTGEQSPWMVLEWIEGVTLGDHLNARRGQGGRSPQECLDLLSPVIDALGAAHEMGIAHRDIKPGNIMLANDPHAASMRGTKRGAARPTARVLDFGIAKLMSEGEEGPASGQTATHSLMSSYSPRYAAPEQASGTRTGPWTDVHALGLILTEMLTDRAPYESGDKLRLTMQVMAPTRPTPGRFGVDVGAWEAVLNKALALTPAERFANAGELLTALEANVPTRGVAVTTEPLAKPLVTPPKMAEPTQSVIVADISTLRPTTSPQTSATASGTRGVVIVAAVVLCALVAGTAAVLRMRANGGATVTPAAQPTAQPPAALEPSPTATVAAQPARPTQAVQAAQAAPPAAPSTPVADDRAALAAQPALRNGRVRPARNGRGGRTSAAADPTALLGEPQETAPSPRPVIVAPAPTAPSSATSNNPLE
jgi:serine/threonine protein kinase